MRGRVALVLALALVAACTDTPSPHSSVAESSSSLALPVPGRPFDAAAIIEVMRDSRRPGGVPDQLETDAIAGAIADQIWTIDGEPWARMSTGGSCGPVRCTLEIGGAGSGSVGEDLWAFEVIPASGEVALLDADLRSMPGEVVAQLDALARAADARIEAGDLLLASVRWLPPPGHEMYELSYRSGNEEGSCELELTVDPAGDVGSERATGC